jgi:hypothetical protein
LALSHLETSASRFKIPMTNAAIAYAASGFLGVLLYGGLRGAGVRWVRRQPDQAADYEDRP